MKTSSAIVVIVMAAFGAFIGFTPSTNTVTASPPIILPEIKQQPVISDPLNLNIDLETGQFTVENANNENVSVSVNHKVVETPPEYITKTKVVEKEVYIEDIIKSTKLMNKLKPLEKPVPPLLKNTDRKE